MAVAATADGWNTAWNCTVAEYTHRIAELEAICATNGRNPSSLRRSLGLITLIGKDNDDVVAGWRRLQRWAPGGALNHVSLKNWAASRLVGTPPQIREQVHRWTDRGVEQVICSLGAPFAIHDDEQLTLLAEATVSC
jgi:alkanesulfonate monooxygenase SsuD/methylene tetrahydromethanopterin reductase-like flavin-dependent oxidoreductase (luciferase family)